MSFKEHNSFADLELIIVGAYESSPTIEESERNAARFLQAQLAVSDQLKALDLDARMRKTGLKAIKSAVRSAEIAKHDKKPTEGALEDAVNLNEEVQAEQDALDKAEVERDGLERYYNVFKDAHIYFRGIAKGRFE